MQCFCGFDTNIVFKKPDHFTPSVGTYICEACHSNIQYRMVHKGKHQVQMFKKIVNASMTLIRLLSQDEAEYDRIDQMNPGKLPDINFVLQDMEEEKALQDGITS